MQTAAAAAAPHFPGMGCSRVQIGPLRSSEHRETERLQPVAKLELEAQGRGGGAETHGAYLSGLYLTIAQGIKGNLKRAELW